MAYEALYTKGRPKKLAQLIGQEHIVNALTRAASGNRLSHAYLLVGTRGTGKTTTARILAKTMNCERVLEAQQSGRALTAKDIPCNECASCRSIDSSPDNVEFDAASNRSVDDISRVLATAYLAPIQSRVKTFIIDEVHMLSTEAINSILKLIEEPPPNVAFFLATTELNKVPMTIRSRCQVLNFRLIPQETIAPYLLKLAARLDVELEEAAAKKIARIAEGSMRDAITYLDQCYAMSDEKISLDDVNATLGLVSDADLDEIIAAVKAKNRAAVGQAINHAFQSGLSSVSIAEALITRLRDLEFEKMNMRSDSELQALDAFVDAMRKATLEMNGSGIPDIILEMTLLKLTTPKIIPLAAPAEKSELPAAPPARKLTGNLDDDKEIIYDIVDSLPASSGNLRNFFSSSIVITNIADDTVTLGFKSPTMKKSFLDYHQTKFEKILAQEFGRPMKVEILVDAKLKIPMLDRVKKNPIKTS